MTVTRTEDYGPAGWESTDAAEANTSDPARPTRVVEIVGRRLGERAESAILVADIFPDHLSIVHTCPLFAAPEILRNVLEKGEITGSTESMEPEFTIHDLRFEVLKGSLSAVLADGTMKWSASVAASYPFGRIGDEEWNPLLAWEDVAPFKGRIVQQWPDLLPQQFSWQDCYDQKTESYHATLAVFSPRDIYAAEASFTALDKRRCLFKLQGKCDLNFDEHYDEGLQVSVISDLAFEGIKVGRLDEDAARREVGRFISHEKLAFSIGPGGAMLKLRNGPSNDEDLRLRLP